MTSKSHHAVFALRRGLWMAIFAIALPFDVYGQSLALPLSVSTGRHEQDRYHTIKSGDVVAILGREICSDTFQVGDTVSATLRMGRNGLSQPKWWPKEFTVILRRDAPVRSVDMLYPDLTLVQATINKTIIRKAQGVFRTNVEATYHRTGDADVLCYAEFDGILTRSIHVR